MALSFALARAGFSEGSLETTAAVKLEQQGDGFAVTRSDLTLKAEVPGISPDQFDELAAGAKANCPISKLLKAEITLSHTLA
jgi:osmotically inducible protein OsmC